MKPLQDTISELKTQEVTTQIVVVLGMHRSGTSAITRGLTTMGISLGSRLMPPVEGDNKKGYFEDIDLYKFDEEVLEFLGRRWTDLSPLENAEVEKLEEAGYVEKAVALLKMKTVGVKRLGIKDPRVAKLLPFWIRVFKNAKFDVRYVIAIRNPLSVAKSLYNRDKTEQEASFYMWADHLLCSLIYTLDQQRVLIDYDDLMVSPLAELKKISELIDVGFQSDELESYTREFLEAGLRHSQFNFEDVQNDLQTPRVVKELYKFASNLLVSNDSLGRERQQKFLLIWKEELERARQILDLSDQRQRKLVTLQTEVNLLQGQLQNIQNALNERDSLNASYSRNISELHERINELSDKAIEADAKISLLHQLVNERDQRILDLNANFLSKEAESIDLMNTISDYENAKTEYDQKIAGLSLEVDQGRHQIAILNQVITETRQSTSWRLTAPLRWFVMLFRRGQRLNPSPAVSLETPQEASLNIIEEQKPKKSASFDILSGLAEKIDSPNAKADNSKLIAFYLPQFHRIPENSEWWGPGFTEWTNVVKGQPNFEGHYQPHLPRELGFYDLSSIEVMREQAELAKLYGVGTFCFYYYWFSGRRILNAPIDNFLNSDVDINYCLCWANENWTRTWDGDTRSVLMEQKYLEEDPSAFIESVLPHFRDRRYLYVEGKPMLVVYRAKDIPNVNEVFRIWRNVVIDAGFPGLHIAAVDFYDISRPDEVGADALVEFPPHKFNGPQSLPNRLPTLTNQNFRGGIVDYTKVMVQSANRQCPDFTLYRGVIPSWDNTARRQDTPTILYGSSPALFSEWLRYVRAYTREVFQGRSDAFIFVNAWNEWGEGCHLEPDQKWGLGYLEALKISEWYDIEESSTDLMRKALLDVAAASIAQRDGCAYDTGDQVQLVRQSLESTRAAEGTVQKLAFALRDYPLAHWVGKQTYRLYLSVRGF